MTLGSVPETVTEQDLDEERNASRQGKSESAYRTISEVANDLNLPQHVLRFWESKFKQISPLKRGGGRRYYRPQDVDLIKRIHHLLHTQGYTIKGVQKLFVKDRLLEQSVKSGQPAANEQPSATVIETSSTAQPAQQALFAEAGSKTGQADLQLLLKRLKNLRDHINARC